MPVAEESNLTEATELNDIICPTCGDEGQIVTTWSGYGRMGDYIWAQWVCDKGHRWESRSDYCDELGDYITTSVTNWEIDQFEKE